MRELFVLLCVLLVGFTVAKAPFTVNDLHRLVRVQEYDVNHKGDVVYSARYWNEKTGVATTLLKLLKSGEPEPVVLTNTTGVTDFNPVFINGGESIAFLSTRSGNPQIFSVGVTEEIMLNDVKQLTNLSVPINSFKYSENGQFFVMAINVFPDCKTLKCTSDRDAEVDARGPNSWMHFDKLFYRHWDTWDDGKVSHLFLFNLTKPTEEPTDIMLGNRVNSPVPPFGGAEQYDISPDGKNIVYTGESASDSSQAWTTGWQIYTYNIASEKMLVISETEARTQNPSFSPNGKQIAYLSMDRPGFEADKLHIVIYDLSTKKNKAIHVAYDISFDNIVWDTTSTFLYGDADYLGNHSLFLVNKNDNSIQILIEDQTNNNLKVTPSSIFLFRNTLKSPNEVWSFTLENRNVSEFKQLTFESIQLDNFDLVSHEVLYFNGSLKENVQIIFLKPVGWKSGKKYPLVQLIHGGPQQAWGDDWSYRWNPQLWASHGYAVAMINFHGSTGFGQNFTDAIRENWGSYPFWDIINGTKFLLEEYQWIDPARVSACGASYGGYMINWILGNTKIFKSLVVHDGIFDTRAAYFSTEEIWFPEWENNGDPYTSSLYEKWNPALLTDNWVTPTLVIHGGRDYRLDISQGLSTFTALQRKGIKSRLLYLPLENHWVLNPYNGIKWYQTVLDWLDTAH